LSYMFSKIVVLGMLCLFQSAVLVFVVELGEQLQQGIFLPHVLETYITLVLTSLAGLMIGLAISAIAPNTDRAVSSEFGETPEEIASLSLLLAENL
jgi:hypothetical protein